MAFFEVVRDAMALASTSRQPPTSAQSHAWALRTMQRARAAHRRHGHADLGQRSWHARDALTLPPRRPAQREASSRPARMASTVRSH
ncbi:hypothetical protein ACU4GD_28345 [Cupriavidus basilensis]